MRKNERFEGGRGIHVNKIAHLYYNLMQSIVIPAQENGMIAVIAV